MILLFVLMLTSFSVYLESKKNFNIGSKIKNIFVSKPKFNISTRECLTELDGFCKEYNYTAHYQMNLIPSGLARLANHDYDYKMNVNTLTISWLELNCNCWDWTCKKEERCNLADKGASCIQYVCSELNGKKRYFVGLIKS